MALIVAPIRLALILPAVLCASSTSAQETGELADLVGIWTLVAIDERPIEPTETPPFLEILEDGTASGMSGVNRFTTRIEIDEGRVSFGPTASTRMAGAAEAMELERVFLARLGSVSTFEIDGDTLQLRAEGSEALTFERKPMFARLAGC